MGALKGLSVFVLALGLVACATFYTDEKEAKQEQVTKASASTDEITAEVERQIVRIKEKLKETPTVKGWILVGDAQMHLKRYDEAVRAYQEAYLLSDGNDGPRKKLRRAMYFSGLELSNQHSEKK